MTRREELLEVAAKCYDNSSDPFCTEVLSKNHVTADECQQLSEDISLAIRVFNKMPSSERIKYTLNGDIDDNLLTLVTNSLRTKELRKKAEIE